MFQFDTDEIPLPPEANEEENNSSNPKPKGQLRNIRIGSFRRRDKRLNNKLNQPPKE
jgi:hypothetical protein